MRTYEVTLTGLTDLIMHADNIEWADRMEEWKNDPANKKMSRAGDDRTPPFRWIGALYHDNQRVVIPSENLMRCLMEGGVMVPVPGGRGGKTFKAQTQSGCMTEEPYWPLLVDGREIPMGDINALIDEPSFSAHQSAANALGFELFVKRAAVGRSKHIRVRPKFRAGWKVTGRMVVLDEQITEDVFRTIWQCSGTYKGLCDWRPGGPTPGSYGRFDVEVKEV